MNSKDFKSVAPGRLVAVTTPLDSDCSFIPSDLPPKWTFDPRLWPLLVEAKEALGTLNGIGQTLSDPRLLPADRRLVPRTDHDDHGDRRQICRRL